jgi:hypothetical protein
MGKIRGRSVAVGIVLGAAAGLVAAPCGIGMYLWFAGGMGSEALPRLTREDFEAAQARWKDKAPGSYDLDIVVAGSRPGTVHVEVRGGAVTAMTRDGVAPSQRRTWDVWTVEGQFDVIALELAAASEPEADFGGAKGSQLVLWAIFDPEYGYPRRYRRVIIGSPQEADWETMRFNPLP